MTKLQEYRNHMALAKDLIEKHSTEIINDYFKTVFNDYPKLNILMVYGYTPITNDGDACYHRQEIIIDPTEINEYFNLWDLLDELYDDQLNDRFKNLNSNISKNEIYDISYKIDEQLLEDINGTDWAILAILHDDGTIQVEYTDYDCGY